MEFLELAADRYSVRSFSDRPIEQEKMDKILKAAQLAPTAVNYQPQKIYILKSGQAVETIRSICPSAYDAPVVFLICADESLTWKHPKEHGYSTGEMDASIVCTHMMLEAWELGIGSVWVRAFDSKQVARAFNLPRHIKPVCLLPVGYPSAESKPYVQWHNSYRSIEEMVEEI